MPLTEQAPFRVVVADDSAFMRRLIVDTLERHGVEVVGVVNNGQEAITACREHNPDVLTLDLTMPKLDGIGVLRGLEGRTTARVVVVSSFNERAGARAVDALAEGAFDLVPKMNGEGTLESFCDALIEKVRLAASTKPGSALKRPRAQHSRASTMRVRQRDTAVATGSIVVILSSTGGPRALAQMIPKLPSPLGAGTLIVQHMPAGFTRSLAARLDAASKLTVVEASDGYRFAPDTALVAPGGRHTQLKNGAIKLVDGPAVHGLKPCGDVTLADVVSEFGERVVLVVLTGMGRDGSEGARMVRGAGGTVFAQDAASSTVFGMPRSVAEGGFADLVAPLSEMADAIEREVRGP